MKKEFDTILADLKTTMNLKVRQLSQKETFDAYDQGRINNIQKRIVGLEKSAKEILDNYANNQDLLINFKKRAVEIKQEIDELS